MSKSVLTPVVIQSFTTLVDRGVKIVVLTEDHTKHPNLLKELGGLQQVPATMYITTGEPNQEQMAAMDKVEARELMSKKPATKSQRLRHAIYRYWEQHISDMSAEAHYDREMDALTDKYISQLD